MVNPSPDQRKGMQRCQYSQRLDLEVLCHRKRHDLVADQGERGHTCSLEYKGKV